MPKKWKYAMPAASSARPMGSGANIGSGASVIMPLGRLSFAVRSRSLSRISGELPTIVRPPPMTMAAAMGSSRRDSGRPVREDRREATGRYSAITDGFCITDELRPAMAVVSRISRCSTPCARRSSHAARRFSAPVRSRPAPRIMVAMTLTTAFEAKPL